VCVRARARVCVRACVWIIFYITALQATNKNMSIISDFAREMNEIYALLAYYAVYGGDFLPKFRDKCREMSVRNHHHTLHNIPEECIFHQNIRTK